MSSSHIDRYGSSARAMRMAVVVPRGRAVERPDLDGADPVAIEQLAHDAVGLAIEIVLVGKG